MDLFGLELLKDAITQWLQMHHTVKGCSLIWESGLFLLESKQLNKLRRHPHYHYIYSIIKSMLWIQFKIESRTAVRLLTKDFSMVANSFSRDTLLYFNSRFHISLSIWRIFVCLLLYFIFYFVCLSKAITH